MAETPDNTHRHLEEVVAEVDDAFWDNRTIIFGAEGEKMRKLFDHLKRTSRTWERPGKCMHRACPKPSISRSHSIHRAGSLGQIAENQHVLTHSPQPESDVSLYGRHSCVERHIQQYDAAVRRGDHYDT